LNSKRSSQRFVGSWKKDNLKSGKMAENHSARLLK
jgi:hypothetical protein